MSDVRAAIYGLLSADADVTDLLSRPTAIHHRRAPQSADFPYIIFHKQAGTTDHSFRAATVTKNALWTVKAVQRGDPTVSAEQISDAIENCLDGAAIAVPGQSALYLGLESDVDFGETDGDALIHHVGGIYRLLTQRN